MTKLSLAQAVPAMAFAPVMLARDAGLFAEEGIDLDHQIGGSAANSLAALQSGEVHLMAGGGDTLLTAYEKRLDAVAIAGVTTANLFSWAVGNRFLEQKGVGRQSPLAERVAALRGARVGTANIGGLGHRLGNFMLAHSGYDGDSYVEWAAAGTGTALAAALRESKVDVIFNGVPDPEFVEDAGIGQVYIIMAEEFPVTQSFVHNALAAKRQWAEANPDLAQRAARAIGRAANRLRNDPEGSKQALQGAYPALKPSVMDLALAHAKPAFAPDARMTETMWRNTIEVYRATGTVSNDISPAEGAYWTNKYLVDVPSQ
ncbi:MAG TPA: ABC transporter substrate-binding protein [Chloroflexota bacterium]|nr:ABC transporter substrate-binding protein [Chloroflexota bacterium]